MSDQAILLSILFLALFLLDLLLSAAAASLENISRARLLALRHENTANVDSLTALLDSPRRYSVSQSSLRFLKKITLILITGIVLVFLIFQFSAADLPVVDFLFHIPTVFVILLVLLLVGTIMTWGEALIIEQATRQPEKYAISLSGFIRIQEIILSPLLILPFILIRKSAPSPEPGTLVTEDELKSMVDASEQGGILEQEERKMIYSIFDLGDTIAREVMIPRIDILALDVNDDIEQTIDTLLESGYSRVPIYEGTIDNIAGLLYTKDLFKAWRMGSRITSLGELLRPAYFIPEAKNLDELLAEMQTRRIHMAIAVDEYGGVAGLVTLEDIVEEIVGDIRDEFDDGEEIMYRQVSEDVYLCSGRMNLDDVNDLLTSAFPMDEADTLGGLIYNRIGHVPVAGETIRVDNVRLTVEQVHKRRISLVRVERLSAPEILAESEQPGHGKDGEAGTAEKSIQSQPNLTNEQEGNSV